MKSFKHEEPNKSTPNIKDQKCNLVYNLKFSIKHTWVALSLLKEIYFGRFPPPSPPPPFFSLFYLLIILVIFFVFSFLSFDNFGLCCDQVCNIGTSNF